MAAVCWAHAVNLSAVLRHAPSAPDPLGTCFVCSVFVCAEHAEKERKSGKWICFPTVANVLAASAGVGDPVAELQLTSPADFADRFPIAARVTAPERRAAATALADHRNLLGARGIDHELLADAVALASVLLGHRSDTNDRVDLAREVRRTLSVPEVQGFFAAPFVDLLLELWA